MNYRHSYHAGNFADVFKHTALIALLNSFLKKDAPFCYLETHAGAGKYDLLVDSKTKNPEHSQGITKLFEHVSNNPVIQTYLSFIKKINKPQRIQFYPGSPLLAHGLLRTQDRMILSELHAETFQALKQLFRGKKQISLHKQDGYQSLKACTPPKEKRGLVLIDPPYEKPNELIQLPALLAQALKRWPTGVFALWYPIKNNMLLERFYKSLQRVIVQPYLTLECCILPNDVPTRLNGCGLIIVNPPWQSEQNLQQIGEEIWGLLNQNKGHFLIKSSPK